MTDERHTPLNSPQWEKSVPTPLMGEGEDEGEICTTHFSPCLKKSFLDFENPDIEWLANKSGYHKRRNL